MKRIGFVILLMTGYAIEAFSQCTPPSPPTLTVTVHNCSNGAGGGEVRITNMNPALSYLWYDRDGIQIDGNPDASGVSFNITGPNNSILEIWGITGGVNYPVSAHAYSSPTCFSSLSSATVQYKIAPTVSVGTDVPSSICVSQSSFALTGGSPTGGTWWINNVASTAFDPAALGVGSHTVKYGLTDANGCYNQALKTVTVTGPNVTVGSMSTCGSNVAFMLSNASPTGGTWSGSYVSSGLFNADAAGPGAHTVSYSYTSNGCTVTKSGTVNVSTTRPAFPSEINVFSSTACGSGSVRLTADFETGGNVSYVVWFDQNGTLIQSATDNYYDTPVLTAPLTYAVRAVLSSGCMTEPLNITADVKPTPVAPVLAVTAHNCSNGAGSGSVTITNMNPSLSYFWYNRDGVQIDGQPDASGVAFNITGQNNSILEISGITGGVDYPVSAHAYSSPTCLSSLSSATVLYKTAPTVSIGTVLPSEVCITQESFTLTGADPTGGTWTINNIAATTFNPSSLGPGSHIVKYGYSDSFGCYNQASKTVTVGPNVTVGSMNTCASNVVFELGNASPAGGTWSGSHVASGLFNADAAGPGAHTVSYTYTANGCTVTKSGTVNVSSTRPTFPSEINLFSSMVCGSGSARLTASFEAGGNVAYVLWFDQNGAVIRDAGGTLYGDNFYDTPVLTGPVGYSTRAMLSTGCLTEAGLIAANVVPVPATPALSVTGHNCSNGAGGGSVTITNMNPSLSYFWYNRDGVQIDGQPDATGVTFNITGTNNSILEISGIIGGVDYPVSAQAYSSPTCLSGVGSATVLYRVAPTVITVPDKIVCDQGITTTLMAGGPDLVKYEWFTSQPLMTVWKEGAEVNSNAITGSHEYWVIGYDAYNCSVVEKVIARYSARPAQPEISNASICAWESLKLNPVSANATSFNWYNRSTNELLYQGATYAHDPYFSEGTHLFNVEAVNGDGCVSAAMKAFDIAVSINCDNDLNWVETRTMDALGNTVSHGKAYFDKAGNVIQSQTKQFESGKIFASQSILDRYGRAVGSTLSAPTTLSEFSFRFNFVQGLQNTPYSPSDFDNPNSTLLNPQPVSEATEGTLGWYYSENNTWEERVPVTDFPYTRTDFYEDGTNEVRFSATAGDQHRRGSGHEVLSGTFPIYHELDDYLARRTVALPAIKQLLSVQGTQSVVRDENGKYSISITEKSGKTVMTCRPGKAEAGQHNLVVNNGVTSSNDPASSDFRPLTYFYLLENQIVSITGSTLFIVEDLVNGVRKPTGQTFANLADGNKWPAGFYRLVFDPTAISSDVVQMSWTNYFTDVAYQFYDDAGRLKVSVSPNGFQKWIEVADPNANFTKLDKTTYDYNHQGWLLSITEPDAGKTKYVYRKDGKIRYSQNEEQATTGRFSYTQYDQLGRPFESGEYIGSAMSFVDVTSVNFLNSTMHLSLESVNASFPLAEKRDWVITHYDVKDPSMPVLPSGYEVDFLRGAVAWTENINNKTWYSYDEVGRVKWMAQKPKALDRVFVSTYTYDFLGKVITAVNASCVGGTMVSPFYHHYEYDADQRLKKVSTSVDGSTLKLRATYEYYLHGPLKRIELGDQLQGIDFVYNIHGWLTQINHPDKLQDPGSDGNDAFGMVIDYYENTMTNSSVSLKPNGNFYNLAQRHHGLRTMAEEGNDMQTRNIEQMKQWVQAVDERKSLNK